MGNVTHTLCYAFTFLSQPCHRINNKSSLTFGESFNMKRQLIIDALGLRIMFLNEEIEVSCVFKKLKLTSSLKLLILKVKARSFEQKIEKARKKLKAFQTCY